MKLLAISASPRKEGNTITLLNEALKAAQGDGAETEFYSVSGKNIQPCDGCWGCRETGVCHIKDDMQELYDKMAGADGIIFGTPIYFYAMTAQSKAVMDRTIALNKPEKSLTNKVGGVVAVCGSLGLVDALKDFAFYFSTRRMLNAGHVAAYSGGPEELKKMEQCMKAISDLGRMMVAVAKQNFKYPAEFIGRPIAYGTHTK